MSVVIVNYGSGNLRSAAKAFERGANELGVSEKVFVSGDPDIIRKADRIVLPGVGAFSSCLRQLNNIPGLVDILNEVVNSQGVPFLGICVGMQLLSRESSEHGNHKGFNWIPGKVSKISCSKEQIKIPHMGWNTLRLQNSSHAMVKNMPQNPNVYFVHSYSLHPDTPEDVIATTEYGGPLTAMVARDNILGTQFHPEKSQSVGLTIIKNFLKWQP